MSSPVRIELPTIFNMGTVNCYLFTEPEVTLIDCGEKTDQSWAALENGLAEQGLSVKDLEQLVITHAHVDHMGMAGKIAQHSDATILVSDYAYDWAWNLEALWNQRSRIISGLLEQHLPTGDAGRALFHGLTIFMDQMLGYWDVIPKERLQRFSAAEPLSLGASHWQVLYMPGHSNTQTCFFQPDTKQLLSADMLLERTPAPVIEEDPGHPGSRLKSLPQMLESYDTLNQLSIDQVFPGHYQPFSNAHELIWQQVERIHARKTECLQWIRSGKQGLLELFSCMYPGAWNLPGLTMLIGYLDLLEAEGSVESREVEGRMIYLAR